MEWEADVVLTDGGVAHLRPIRPSDADMLVQFYDRVSPESKYLRFFAPYPKLSDRDVARFTQVDYVDRVALILTVGDQMIAVGQYDRLDDNEAEVAFLVEDAHRGRGSRSCCSSISPRRPGNRGSAASWPRSFLRIVGWRRSSPTPGTGSRKGSRTASLKWNFPSCRRTPRRVMEPPGHRAESASVHRLLIPDRVVVYGPQDIVQRIVDSVLGGGFREELIGISSDGSQIRGVQTAASP